MDEHVLASVITNDETEAFLRIEEFDDAFAFANDLGRHSAAATASAAAETSAAAATAAKATATAAALLKSAALFGESLSAEEIVTLIAAAPAAVAFAPSVETHACPNFRVPTTI